MGEKYDYVIVGAGVNGTSIAAALAAHGFRVCVVERSDDGYVAADGASHDLNKIVRADYTDANFCTLAKEAIARWRASPILARFYHEVGVLFRSSDSGEVWGVEEGSAETYVANGLAHAMLDKDRHLEVFPDAEKRTAYKLHRDAEVDEILGAASQCKGKGLTGMGKVQTGYFNPRAGWAEANNATRALLDHARSLGVHLEPNTPISGLVYDHAKVSGVRTEDGRTILGDNVVLATGAWTASLLSTLLPGKNEWMTRPSAQCVAVMRLTAAEAEKLAGTPVIINFATGFYQFEPTPTGDPDEWHMKIAIHSNGFLHPQPSPAYNGSYPGFTSNQSGEVDSYGMAEASIPPNQLELMLCELGHIWPALARREKVVTTRVCWYSDTLDENWLIDRLSNHPCSPKGAENVWIVSGDSGHAFKFLPLIGDIFLATAKIIPNTRAIDLAKFTFQHHAATHKACQNGQPVTPADSNRAHSTPLQNARARL